MRFLLAHLVPYRRPQYLRAAHYFGDGWPLDALMTFRQPQLRRDLRRLRRDGFNCIVLVVPWRGFQVSQDPPEYDPFYSQQLERVVREARIQRLAVLVRVSYTHQVMPGPSANGIRFAQDMLLDAGLASAWLACQERVVAIAEEYRNFAGAFVSWEELWHAFAQWQQEAPGRRRQLAEALGFLDFARGRGCTALERIPGKDEPEHGLYLEFVNARIRELVTTSRARCPSLGVEYRVDKDPVTAESGEVRWQENDAFPDFAPARYAYWAPFMGAENSGGERLDVEQSAASLESMLREATDDGRVTGLVLEQFNFIDSTRKFADAHARIDDDDVAQFLSRAAPLLSEYTTGYGIWAPRDYRCNVLYNAAILSGGRGWELEGSGSRFLPRGGCSLGRDGVLRQTLRPKVAGVPRIHPFDSFTLRIAVRGRVMPGQLLSRVNGGDWVPLAPTPDGAVFTACLPVRFETLFTEGLEFELQSAGAAVRIGRLHLFNDTYTGAIRDADGRPGPYLEAVRALNGALP